MENKSWKIILAIMTVNVTMMAAGYTMLIPFLPMYLTHELGVGPEEVKLWNGAIFSVTFLLGGILAPIWGKMADTKGKRLMALRAGSGLAISYFLGGLVTSPEQLFGVRVIQGFAAGLWSVCLAIATSFAPSGSIGTSLGIMQAALTTGNVIGPLVGGLLSTYFGMRSSFFVAGTLLTIITLIFYFYIPEPPRGPAVEQSHEGLLQRPAIRKVLVLVGLFQLVILLVQPVIGLYVAELLPGSDNVIFLSGLVFSMVGIAAAITAPIWGRFGQGHGFHLSLTLSAGLSAIMAFGTAMPDSFTTFCVLNFIYGLFCSGIAPSLSAIMTSHTALNERGRAFGYMFSAQQFGSMIGPIIGAGIITVLPLKSVFMLAALLLAVLCYCGFRDLHRDRE